MKTILINIAALALSVSIVACGPKKEDSKKEAEQQNEQKFEETKIKDDTDFAVNAADAGMLEVKLGELAQTNGYSAQVKSFGKLMADEHGKANAELKTVASQKDITLPETLSNNAQEKYNDLLKKTGKDFDEAYTDAMVKGHKDVLDLFQKEASEGKDADLKSWAVGKVGVIEHHLEMAKQTEEVVDKQK